jgi:hypothetical protein
MANESELERASRDIHDAALYFRGMSEALTWAAELCSGPAEDPAVPDTSDVASAQRAAPNPSRAVVARPILEILRDSNRPLRISEIMTAGHAKGHDLLRSSVSNALTRLSSRGLVGKVGHAYQIQRLTPKKR